MNIAQLAVQGIETYGEHVSVVFEAKEITNVEMDLAARKLGNALRNLEVTRGDRVILQMPNCPEVLQAFQAVWKIGTIVIPINYMVGEEEIAYIYRDSGANTVITSPLYLPKVQAAMTTSPGIKNVIVVAPEAPEGTLSYGKLIEGSSDELEMVETENDDTAALVYTSGTTGQPKGVMHTHFGLYSNAKAQCDSTPFPPDMISLAVLPLCHSYGIAVMNGAFLRGKSKTIVLPSVDLEKMFSSIERYKIESVAAVPTIYVYMLLYPDAGNYNVSSVKYWTTGSAPLAYETWKEFKEKFGGEITEGWGLTEAAANNTINPYDERKKLGSIGLPMKGIEMRIFDDDDNELPPGKEGEIVIRGPMVMKGYWNKPEETADVIRNGWLHTGDVGYVDEEGFFFITDRKKDIIIKGGENISPRTIEEVLYQYPKVSEAAVIGIKDPVYGEDIKAFVTLKPGETATVEEIMEFCTKNLKRFRVPKELVIMDALPKNLVGKILKKELRKL